MRLRDKVWTIAAMAAALFAGPGLVGSAQAYTETVLYSACPSGVCNGLPRQQVLKSGNVLYGVGSGGANGAGVVWQYDLGSSTYSVLYDFCQQADCTDGDTPSGPLIIDTAGNLYGVTQFGGGNAFKHNNAGTVFRLNKPSSGSWTLTRMYSFCPIKVGSGLCPDGNDPMSGLTYAGAAGGTAYDGTSLLFGTTLAGGGSVGTLQGDGVVFAIKNNGSSWSEKAIHVFCAACSASCTVCGDGVYPLGQVVMDASNDIWGTTIMGGIASNGAAYKLAPGTDLWNDPWTSSVIYNFCWTGASKCPDGSSPNGLIQDAAGNLWGTAYYGGNGPASTGDGVLFKLNNPGGCTEGGTATFWCSTVKHNFCSSAGCSDGAYPNGDIVMDSSGDIFGTTTMGGSSAVISGGAGAVWKQSGATESVLYAFCPSSGCSDGQRPLAGATMDSSAKLYGTTMMGGSHGDGAIYKLTP
ncbi:MAG TPA: choice-of-anchor tandem repeat GloVer-containing protein [Rhizomicrobium sp.]|nr:choice-of-anchor tandem repeat GloVer-containing protein [Rhizomicrobium sp.]